MPGQACKQYLQTLFFSKGIIYTSSFWWRAQHFPRLINTIKSTTTFSMLSTSWYLFSTRYKQPHKTITVMKNPSVFSTHSLSLHITPLSDFHLSSLLSLIFWSPYSPYPIFQLPFKPFKWIFVYIQYTSCNAPVCVWPWHWEFTRLFVIVRLLSEWVAAVVSHWTYQNLKSCFPFASHCHL